MDAMEGVGRPIRMAVLDSGDSAVDLASRVAAGLPHPCEDPLIFRDKASLFITCLQARPTVFIVDIDCLDGESGLSRLASQHPQALLIATARSGGISRMFSVLEAGAHEFLTPPFDPDQLVGKIGRYLLQHSRGSRSAPQESAGDGSVQAGADDPSISAEPAFEGFIGTSARMKAVYGQIERVAASFAPVFITGESGTGKVLCARAIHARSPRAHRPFVAVNCANVARDRLEGEIFGEGGAAERASGGTLFLGGVGELDLALQSKLLRLLQTSQLDRTDGTGSCTVDLRIVCATSRNPAEEVAQGRFREDLFYRLHVLPIHLPPLRDRREDILPLAVAFLRHASAEEGRGFSRFDTASQDRLLAYGWPGNVRQLENAIRQAVVLNEGNIVRSQMLPAFLSASEFADSETRGTPLHRTWSRQLTKPAPAVEPLWLQERRIIEDALAAFDGNISQAAAALEISPSTIYRKKQSWAERLAG